MTRCVVARLKPAIFSVLGYSPFLSRRIYRLKGRDVLTIVNLHRVDDHKGSAYQALHPTIFSDLVGYLKREYEIVTFGELGERKIQSKPWLILSFDDGYKDFIEVVAPILERHGVRANQNVIPECIETGYPPMNVMLQDFIGTAPSSLLREIELPGLAGGLDPADRARTGLRASAALKDRSHAEQLAIFAQLKPQFERFDGFAHTPVMSRADVREIAGIHELGAHSYSHATMAAETNDYLEEDLRRCRAYFSQTLELPVSIYAFPNGSCRNEQIQIAQDAGFKHVLLVGDGFSSSSARVHQRFNVYGSTCAEAKFRATGGFRRAVAVKGG